MILLCCYNNNISIYWWIFSGEMVFDILSEVNIKGQEEVKKAVAEALLGIGGERNVSENLG